MMLGTRTQGITVKIRHAAPLILAVMALPSASMAQDVGVFSAKDADDILAAPAVDASADDAATASEGVPPVDGKCLNKAVLINGLCRPTRVITLGGRGKAQSIATPQLINRAPGSAAAVSGSSRIKAAPGKRMAVRPRVGREVPLQFALGSFELSKQSKANLDTLASALKKPENADKRIRISGHTDRSGTLETNQRLSEQRAKAAADYMVSQGVDSARIESIGAADEKLLEGFSPFNARQRRVEVTRIQ